MTGLQRELEAVARHLREVTVQIARRAGGGGAGILWRSDGLIVTNHHVATQPTVQVIWGDRQFTGQVTARDPDRDLASVRIPATGLPAATVGNARALRPGELVLAVGHPLGMTGAAALGVVHAGGERRWIRASVRLAPGNSGGPLANALGQVSGVNSMIVNGLGYAVPAHHVERFVGGRQARLGVALRPVAVRAEAGRRLGLLVLSVEPSGAAAHAGLAIGDVLLAADGKPFDAPDDLAEALAESSGGLTLEWLRGGRWMAAAVQPFQQGARAAA